AGWTCNPFSGGTVTCTIPVLTGTPPSSTTFTLTVTVPSSVLTGTVLTNTVSITSSAVADTDLSNNRATATTKVVTSADLSVLKTASPSGTVSPGQEITYTITATNHGPSPATPTITDAIPSGTTF